MKKLLLLFSLLFFFQSCEREYDGGSRYVFESQVLDSINRPIANLPVNLYVGSASSGFFANNYSLGDLLISTKTDQNGNFKLVFPYQTNLDNQKANIEIGNFNYGAQFSYLNLSPNNFSNFYLKETPIKLYSNVGTVLLNVLINNTVNNKSITNLEIEGNSFLSEKDYDFNINLNLNYFSQIYFVDKNQTIILKYTVKDSQNNPSTFTNFSIPISITDQNLEYTITIN